MINKTDGIINLHATSPDFIRSNSVQYDHTT